ATIVAAPQLEDLATRICAAVGAPDSDARWIATLLVRANLRGHDSHGVIRIPQYVTAVRQDQVNARPTLAVQQDTPTTAVVDGDRGFGQVVARRAAEGAIERAGRQGGAAGGGRRADPLGRRAGHVG